MKPGKNLLNNVKVDRIVLGLLLKVAQKVSKVNDQCRWFNCFQAPQPENLIIFSFQFLKQKTQY